MRHNGECGKWPDASARRRSPARACAPGRTRSRGGRTRACGRPQVLLEGLPEAGFDGETRGEGGGGGQVALPAGGSRRCAGAGAGAAMGRVRGREAGPADDRRRLFWPARATRGGFEMGPDTPRPRTRVHVQTIVVRVQTMTARARGGFESSQADRIPGPGGGVRDGGDEARPSASERRLEGIQIPSERVSGLLGEVHTHTDTHTHKHRQTDRHTHTHTHTRTALHPHLRPHSSPLKANALPPPPPGLSPPHGAFYLYCDVTDLLARTGEPGSNPAPRDRPPTARPPPRAGRPDAGRRWPAVPRPRPAELCLRSGGPASSGVSRQARVGGAASFAPAPRSTAAPAGRARPPARAHVRARSAAAIANGCKRSAQRDTLRGPADDHGPGDRGPGGDGPGDDGPHGGADSLALCRRVLEDAAVAITSGLDFDPDRGHRYVRFRPAPPCHPPPAPAPTRSSPAPVPRPTALSRCEAGRGCPRRAGPASRGGGGARRAGPG